MDEINSNDHDNTLTIIVILKTILGIHCPIAILKKEGNRRMSRNVADEYSKHCIDKRYKLFVTSSMKLILKYRKLFVHSILRRFSL